MKALWGAAVLAFAVSSGCGSNIFTGSLTPVPPVHRLPADLGAPVILIDKDPVIETKDPAHVERANEQHVPRDYRQAMTQALVLGGFSVVTKSEEPHDLVARLAIAVTETADQTRQVYRCGLFKPGANPSEPVAQIDWVWPRGTFVEPGEVFEFASHNLATEVVTSRKVVIYLRSRSQPAAPKSAPAP